MDAAANTMIRRHNCRIRAIQRVWPHPQPCVFMLSLNYFRTQKPYKTLETLRFRRSGAVHIDRSVERPSDNPAGVIKLMANKVGFLAM